MNASTPEIPIVRKIDGFTFINQTIHESLIKEYGNKIQALEAENKLLKEDLNNSKHFHCPHFVTTDNGYVACDLGRPGLQDKLREVIEALEKLRIERGLNKSGCDMDFIIVKTFLESLGEK